jgi:hypothetical protein
MCMQMVMGGSSSGMCDELTEWLVQPPMPTDNPLHWWLANWNLYPHLSQMANYSLYHLATAVDIEHSFSCGRILISHLCNCLHRSSIWVLMCFGDWCRQQLVSDIELTATLSSGGTSTNKKDKAKQNLKAVNCTFFSCISDRIVFLNVHTIFYEAPGWLPSTHCWPHSSIATNLAHW